MTIERINPPTVHTPPIYSHMVKVTGGTLLFLAGQVGLDVNSNLVGENDLGAQAKQAFENVKNILAAANATFANVVKMTIYVANYQFEDRLIIVDAMREAVDMENLPANTLIGVQSLARPGMRIEVDVFAVVE